MPEDLEQCAENFYSEGIRENGFTQSERFVTETELRQNDGIIPPAALLAWYKSLCC